MRAEGVDLTDAEAVKAFAERFNERLVAESTSVLGPRPCVLGDESNPT
jgi:hypothetical protein